MYVQFYSTANVNPAFNDFANAHSANSEQVKTGSTPGSGYRKYTDVGNFIHLFGYDESGLEIKDLTNDFPLDVFMSYLTPDSQNPPSPDTLNFDVPISRGPERKAFGGNWTDPDTMRGRRECEAAGVRERIDRYGSAGCETTTYEFDYWNPRQV